ncbi:conserved hypothetical protein [Leishmania mexicana MHOM/GT/2001/U1103]|uniref:Uncharacterized protein n=1 Tax=Leishmania mexicana (strain MHOM/GT/2001/U1103) TaxID=929439 RepID=E9AQC8_LEIMU|nr:conserved hypothetical protein [Leishmania mexicana MHOM/GT/2001/U1103]CBZ25147.1 conserved hypothetical protein [Leishmania mexicana MHOM/GT/2001/U1103]
MVSASPPQRDRGSPPTPPLPGLQDVDAPAAGTVQALRQTVEAQEAHVRLLRARQAAREALLSHTRRLLAAGDSMESHGSVEQLVRQVESSLQKLQQDGSEAAAPAAATGDDVAPTSAPSLTPRNAAEDADASADPLARIFHSGVEAQLAAVAEPSHTPPASTLAPRSSTGKKKAAGESGLTNAASTTSPPPGVSFPPRSAAMTALLALSASRQEAGRTAMLAALSALELSLMSNSGATEAGRDVHSAEPAWLRQEDGDGANDDGAAPEAQQPEKDGKRGDIASPDYSDDFECRSSTSSGADD